MSAKCRKTIADLGRVIGPEPLSHLGNLMMRHPQYFRGLFLLLTTSAISKENYTRATLSVVILISVRAIGMLLKFGPALLLNRLKKTAELAGHRFNVAQKRVQLIRHHCLFWDYIYEPESRLRCRPEETAEQQRRDERLSNELGNSLDALPKWAQHEINLTPATRSSITEAIEEARPVSCGIEITYKSFRSSFMHALHTSYDRITQTQLTGLSINAIEDYLCSPILGERDDFPAQNRSGNRYLARMRTRLKHYQPPSGTRFNISIAPVVVMWRNLQRNLWHTLVSSVITKHTGNAIRKLNNLCKTEEISVQTLLWPECADAAWIQPDLRQAIITVRQRMLDQAFGETDERTEVMIERLTRWDEVQAMHFRARCDYQYCDLAEPVNFYSDYEELGDYTDRLPQVRQFMESATAELASFRQWMQEHAGCWQAQLTLASDDRIRSIAHQMHRLLGFVREESPEHEELFEQYGPDLETVLRLYHDDEDFHSAGIPAPLIDLVRRYADRIATRTNDLFAVENSQALQAVLGGFQGNFNRIRSLYRSMAQAPEGEKELIELIGNIIEQREDIGTERIELRTHHALCKMQRLLYTEFVGALRHPDRTTRRQRRRQKMQTIHLKAKQLVSRAP
jgi:hypothetical protein